MLLRPPQSSGGLNKYRHEPADTKRIHPAQRAAIIPQETAHNRGDFCDKPKCAHHGTAFVKRTKVYFLQFADFKIILLIQKAKYVFTHNC